MNNMSDWLEIENETDKNNNILDEIKKINDRLDTLEAKINIQNENTKIIMEGLKEIVNEFIKVEKEEIKPMLTEISKSQQKIANEPINNVLEYNRLWRIYSNNFRQNVTQNSSNILTQLALNKH
jgi:hypothetical protein